MARNIAIQLNPLLDKLITQQGKQSDYRFAARLGITRPLWQATRTGKLPIGLTLLRAIIRTYPELTTDVLDFLRGEDHEEEIKE